MLTSTNYTQPEMIMGGLTRKEIKLKMRLHGVLSAYWDGKRWVFKKR